MIDSEKIFKLSEKQIVVTGANGHLGSVMVEGLLSAGAKVLGLSLHHNNLHPKTMDHPSFTFHAIDVTDESGTERAIKEFVAKNGELHGLVNNAYKAPKGIGFNASTAEIQRIFDDCFVHYWTTSRIFMKYRVKDKQCSIVNNGSLWGIVSPTLETYLDLSNEPSIAIVTSKAAIHQLTKYLSVIFSEENVRVNTLVPGFFPRKRGPERLDYLEKITEKLSIRRIGQPSDLVGPAIFLLSEASTYMTGQELIIDGGYLAK